MPRGKIKMSLIGDARRRATVFGKRKAGLVKKADELAKLCGVDIALVVCAGGAPPAVWESDPAGGVIDRYRRLPADQRATHTHLEYINGQLGKEERRLDKKRRQGLEAALDCPDEEQLEDMDLDQLLASIDAALLATAERQKALGVVADDGGQKVSSDAAVPPVVVGQGDGPPFVVGGGGDLDDIQAWVDELMWDDAEPLQLNNASMMQPASGEIQCVNDGNGVDMGSNHQCQAGNGENGHGQLLWHGYQPNTIVSYSDHGFPCTGDSYGNMDMGEYSDMPVPSNANANAYGGWHNQAWWGADESSSVAVLPAAAAAAAYRSLDIAGNPAYMPPQHEHTSMGIASRPGYEVSGCLADDYLQCPDGNQYFGDEPEPLHYLSDMAQGISYYDDLEAGSCSSGRAQLFAQSYSFSRTPTPQFSGYSEQSQSDVGHQYQDPGVQRCWVMEGPPGSDDVATASDRARGGGTWANSGLYQPWISVYQ